MITSQMAAKQAPPIPSEEVAKYDALILAKFNEIKELLVATDWKPLKEDAGVKYFSRSVAGSKFSMIMSTVNIPKPMQAVFENFCSMACIEPDMPKSVRDDTHQRHMYVTEPNTCNDGYLYLCLESPAPLVSGRDFMMYRKHFEEDGKHYFMQTSIDNDTIQPIVKGFVRGKILIQGFVLEPVGDEIKTSFIVHADPCGSMPAMVYNAVASGQGSVVKTARDELMAAK